MSDLLSKISSYNIFNYLFPGALFAWLAAWLGLTPRLDADIVTALLLYYVTGLTISRVGSVILEPILRGLRVIKHAPYAKFVKASKEDDKIDLLVEVSNTYRTLSAGFIILIVATFLHRTFPSIAIESDLSVYIALLVMFVLYVFSHRKQVQFVKRRVEIERQD